MKWSVFIYVALVSGCAAVSVHPKSSHDPALDFERDEQEEGKKAEAREPCDEPDLAAKPWEAAVADLKAQLAALDLKPLRDELGEVPSWSHGRGSHSMHVNVWLHLILIWTCLPQLGAKKKNLI